MLQDMERSSCDFARHYACYSGSRRLLLFRRASRCIHMLGLIEYSNGFRKTSKWRYPSQTLPSASASSLATGVTTPMLRRVVRPRSAVAPMSLLASFPVGLELGFLSRVQRMIATTLAISQSSARISQGRDHPSCPFSR